MKSLQKAQWILLSCLFSFVLQSCEGESPGEKIIVGTWGGRAVNEDVDSEWLEEGVDIEVQMIYDFFSDKTGVVRFSFHVEGEVSLLSQILFFGAIKMSRSIPLRSLGGLKMVPCMPISKKTSMIYSVGLT